MGRKRSRPSDHINIRGFFRVQITEDGQVKGDTGWRPNQVVNLGFSHYLVDLLGQGANSKQISRVVLGNGTEPGATDTSIESEHNTATYTRTTVSFSNESSKTSRFTATFASSDSHITAASSIRNVGIINNTTSAGTIMAGNTFTQSAWNTNQDINVTYEIRFS